MVLQHCLTISFIMLLVMSEHCSAQGDAPTITSQPSTKVVFLGEPVILECQVSNLGSSKISWTFVTDGTTIYQDGILMADNSIKYSIIRPPDSSAYNLQILQVEKSDQGFYKCQIDGTYQSVTIHLDVVGKINSPVILKPDILNRTECCVDLKMSDTCLPSCVPSDVDLTAFNPVQNCAGGDLNSLVHCLTAGSNHENCCLFRGLNPVCVSFCRNEIPDDIGLQHLECLGEKSIDILLNCAREGFATLPDLPRDVLVLPYNDGQKSSIQVKWQAPERNADKVTGYKIMYKRKDMDKYFSVEVDSPAILYTRLSGENVIADRGYDVYVTALAEHGASGPSVEVSLFIPDYALNYKQNKDIDTCCQDRGVSDKCRSYLCQAKTWSHLNIDYLTGCLPQLGEVFTCLVGEQDHSNCCSAFGVADECISLCSGSPPPFNISLLVCAQQMAIIEACVQQGSEILPKPPSNLELQSVTGDTATLTFKPSPSSGIINYMTFIKQGEDNDEFTSWRNLNPSDQSVLIYDLAPSTYYTVYLTAITASGGSLPSESVHFRTYSDPYRRSTVPPVVNIPHNFTDCCYKKGMPDICAIGCKYIQNISAHYSENLETCYSYIGTVLSCASDGRDHADCCAAKNVMEPDCLELCGIAKDGALDDKYIKCLKDTPKAIVCFEEGLDELPRYPNAYVSHITANTISVEWSHPKTGTLIDTYIVSYRPAYLDTYTVVETNKTEFNLNNLKPSTEYLISVSSKNANGTSSPSPLIKQYTEQVHVDKPDFNKTQVTGRKFWANITECCHSSGIPAECIDECLNKQTDSSDRNCNLESHKMLACYADGEDHGECCKENSILPSSCVAICRGHTLKLSLDVMLCMSYAYRDIIFSCYIDNAGLIPGPPMNMYVSLEERMVVKVVWEKPTAYCGSDCESIIHYWREDPQDPGVQMDVKEKVGVTSPYNLEINGIDGHYTFTVTARNSYGSSPPSSRQTLLVSKFNRDVVVYIQGDKKYVEKGEDVILQCAVYEFNPADPYTIMWLFNGKRQLKTTSTMGHTLYLNSIDPAVDEGTYSCHVKDSFVEVTDSLFLPIKYSPVYAENRDETVLPNEGNQAKIACWFYGFPITGPDNWKKDGQAIKSDSIKYSAQSDIRYHTGITAYRLRIGNVMDADYGTYSIGVQNKYGKTACSIKLSNPNDMPTIIPATKQADPKGCCAKKGVSELCQELCSFDVDVAAIINDPKYITCLSVFTSLIECGADGQDHSMCCKNSGVQPYCFPFCAGKSPGSHVTEQLELLTCVSEASQILTCMEEGHKRLPFPPTNVTVRWWKASSTIKVIWSRPKYSHDRIQSYVVYYKSSSNEDLQHHGVNENLQEYEIPTPKTSDRYEVYVVATNKFGSSLKSNVAVLEPLTMNPPSLFAAYVTGTKVTFKWALPPGAEEENISYVIYYKKQNDVRSFQTQNIVGLSYTLSSLEPKTDYVAYITASTSKTYQSAPSSHVKFTTGEKKSGEVIPGPGPKSNKNKDSGDSDDGDKVAIGVGVVVAIIALIAIVAIVFFILKGRGAFNKANDSVAFENPIGSNPGGVKIHGVGSSGDEQFGYGRLEEDNVYDNSTTPTGTGAYENPAYAGQESDQATGGAATLEVNSEA